MLNKPKYSLFSNAKYALDGLLDLIKTESSFKLEILVFIVALIIIYFVDKTLIEKLFLFCSILFILVVEAINGAIERVVDLVTTNYHPLAKKAKDTASAAVFLSVCLAIGVWSFIFIAYP